ncbi:MAG: FecR family protein [Acidobacteriia bacterium]|nr:FecR family protein [Terriglobia bacterium]
MSQSAFRSAVCCLLAILFPAQMMLAGETASAMLYTNGAAWLNGSEVPKSAAVFAGDMLQTRPDSTARIQSNGSSVMVLADSLVKFEGPAVELEHGAVRVTTSRGMAARAGDVTVKPAGDSWTEFQVTDVDGRMQIAANKGDLTVQDDKGTTTVTQGQQTTRDDTSDTEKKKKKHRRGSGAAPAAGGGIMSSPYAVYGGLGVAGGVGLWVWLQSEPPASPACPTNSCP